MLLAVFYPRIFIGLGRPLTPSFQFARTTFCILETNNNGVVARFTKVIPFFVSVVCFEDEVVLLKTEDIIDVRRSRFAFRYARYAIQHAYVRSNRIRPFGRIVSSVIEDRVIGAHEIILKAFPTIVFVLGITSVCNLDKIALVVGLEGVHHLLRDLHQFFFGAFRAQCITFTFASFVVRQCECDAVDHFVIALINDSAVVPDLHLGHHSGCRQGNP